MKRKKEVKNLIIGTIAVFFWIGIWFAVCKVANRNLILKIPTPSETLNAFFGICGKKSFLSSVGKSMTHILSGFTAGAVLGIGCGMLSSHFKIFDEMTKPIQRLIRSVPVAAFIIIAWLWIPTDILPAVISGLMVLPIVWTHTETAENSIEQVMIETAQTEGMDNLRIAFKIKLPLMSENLRKGCITALGIAWKSGIAAEVICNPKGSLGAMLQSAKTSIEYAEVFAVTAAIAILSFICEKILDALWKMLQKEGT